MPRRLPDDDDLSRFMPRITILLVGGFALFLLTTGIYTAPVLLAEPPPGAIQDYYPERVRARLDGKLPWFLTGSFLTMALLAGRGWLPGTRRR